MRGSILELLILDACVCRCFVVVVVEIVIEVEVEIRLRWRIFSARTQEYSRLGRQCRKYLRYSI
jgi:hypothetical protein